jgi:hypothetical protein
MAKQLKLNGSWDLEISNYQLQIVSGADQVAQHIKERLQTFLGEWFLDVTIGFDYFGQVLVKNPDLDTIHAMALNIISSTAGVREVRSLLVDVPDPSTGSLRIQFSVYAYNETINGVVVQ